MTVRLVSDKSIEICDLSFVQEVKERSQAHLERCYQCVACSSGCPVTYQMDYAPHQILHMTQLGLMDRVLASTTIWLCASCETCATRCPNEIDIVTVMDILRYISLREGCTGQTTLPVFHSAFLDGVRSFGRIHELLMIVRYMLASGSIFKLKDLVRDAILGIKMFLRGKLLIFPHRVRGKDEMKRIFQKTEKRGKV
ncbi:4Fe-4S dicluster domain-containing protein [Chloroflexota bacterium]